MTQLYRDLLVKGNCKIIGICPPICLALLACDISGPTVKVT